MSIRQTASAFEAHDVNHRGPHIDGADDGEPEPDDAIEMLRKRHVPWGRIAAVALVAGGMAWVIGVVPSQRHAQTSPVLIWSRTMDNNNALASTGLVPDLEGWAIGYPREVGGLVGPDGQFRTDLSLAQSAAILNIDAATVSKRGSPGELDPDAVLFNTQTGTLTERSKVLSREGRKMQALIGLPTDEHSLMNG